MKQDKCRIEIIKCKYCGKENEIRISNYYGSDLNILLDQKCKRNLTGNNIDLIIWDFDTKQLKIIESKHSNETMKPSQYYLLQFIKEVFEYLNEIGFKSSLRNPKAGQDKNPNKNYRFDVYIHRGDYPYEKSIIKRLTTEKRLELSQNNLIKFLNCEGKK